MQTVRLAAFFSGAGLRLVLPLSSHFHGETPFHPRGNTFPTPLAGRYQEQRMAGTFTPIYLCEESLPFQGTFTTYCALPSRARREKSVRSITHPAESFSGGTSFIIGKARSGSHWEVCCSATAL